MMSSNDVENLEVNINQAREAIQLQKDLNTLESHPSFQRLILKDYMDNECSRLVMLLGDPQIKQMDKVDDVHESMLGIAQLGAFFRRVHIRGDQMQSAIDEMEDTRNDLTAQEL